MFTDQQIKNILEASKIITPEKFAKLEEDAREGNQSLQNYLIDKKIITKKKLYEEAANYFNISFIDLKNQSIQKSALLSIPEPIAITHNLIAFDSDDNEIKIAAVDPEDLEIFEFIKKKTGLKPKIHLTTPENIKEGLKQYRQAMESEFKYFTKGGIKSGKIISAASKEDLKKAAEDLPIVRIVNDLLEYAIFEEASDIHIEPEEKELVVRYRIDGILHNVMALPKNTQAGITARIKILANLKVDEHRLPQDGRFKISSEKYKVSFRTSVIPTFDGEKIVMRLLNEKAQILSLEELGMQPQSLEITKRNIKKPHGMILVTGPTGSGKTTTLYTILNILNTVKVNISTVEDPIEYRIPHINQSQANPKIGFTFANGLRSLLRQDPDIIMVGEIRDEETAEIAVHAAMTGHLLLSTLHTNDAITTLPRIVQMGVPSFLIASTTNLIMSQRLVRKTCLNCREEYKLDKKTVELLKKQFNIDTTLSKLEKLKIITSSQRNLESLTFYRGKGCSKCNHSGYKGRIGIYETLEITEEMANVILKNSNISELEKQAKAQGMLTMVEDGFIKAKNGDTTIEELVRVTKE